MLSSPREGWRGPTLQVYDHPPAEVNVPGRAEHMVVLNLTGKVHIEDRSEGRPLRRWTDAGHVSLTPAGHPVRRRWRGRPNVLVVQLSPAKLGEVADELELDASRVDLVPCLAAPDRQMHRIGRLLLSEVADPGFGTGAVTEALSQTLAVHLLRYHSTLATRAVASEPDLPSGRFARVVDQMRANLGEPLTLAQMSETAGLSRTQFARAFRQATGRAPHAYLVDLRMEEAQRLLERTSLPVTQVALACGFDQPGYFATAFRRRTGFTPRSWRLLRKR